MSDDFRYAQRLAKIFLRQAHDPGSRRMRLAVEALDAKHFLAAKGKNGGAPPAG